VVMKTRKLQLFMLHVKSWAENVIHPLTSSSMLMLYPSLWSSSVVSASKFNIWLFPPIFWC
jgi:hypothetical protein